MKKVFVVLMVLGILILLTTGSYGFAIETEDWESVEELRTFLVEDDTDSRIHIKLGESGVVFLNSVCEYRAMQLRNRAEKIGKNIEVLPISPDEYEKWYGEEVEHYHMIGGAIVGNEYWYIEPSTDEIWIGVYLD